MQCDCRGKRKLPFESFEDIEFEGKRLHICVKCSRLVYKIREVSECEPENVLPLISKLKKRTRSDSNDFKKWFYKECSGRR